MQLGISRERLVPAVDFATAGPIVDIHIIIGRNLELPGAIVITGPRVAAGAEYALVGEAAIRIKLDHADVVAWNVDPEDVINVGIGDEYPPVVRTLGVLVHADAPSFPNVVAV